MVKRSVHKIFLNQFRRDLMIVHLKYRFSTAGELSHSSHPPRTKQNQKNPRTHHDKRNISDLIVRFFARDKGESPFFCGKKG